MSPVSNNTQVTVIGGSGFLGHQVVRRLAEDGYRIRVTSRKPALAVSLKPLGGVGQIAVMRADIRNEAELAAAIDRSEIVVNLVGILKESGGRSFADMHVEGAATVARLAAKAGVRRLVHVSAIGADPAARSAYARSKGQGEAAVRAAFPRATILRPSVMFGPGDGFFNRFASLMRLSRLIFPLFGGGVTKFQPVFVGDVADALANALKDEASCGRTYELGGPAVYTLKDILVLIARLTERKRTFVPIPFLLLDVAAVLTGWLPFAPVTLDQARLLRKDNVVRTGADAGAVGSLADLRVQPTAVEAIVPSYLYSYRPAGQYTEPRNA
jgi:uncharacterized protein YbjT (DUF2867 family)